MGLLNNVLTIYELQYGDEHKDSGNLSSAVWPPSDFSIDPYHHVGRISWHRFLHIKKGPGAFRTKREGDSIYE